MLPQKQRQVSKAADLPWLPALLLLLSFSCRPPVAAATRLLDGVMVQLRACVAWTAAAVVKGEAPSRAGVSSDDVRTREGRQRRRAHRGVVYRCLPVGCS